MSGRKPLKNRPWITNTYWDRYSRATVLHVDAYLIEYYSQAFLLIECLEGGKVLKARDAYAISQGELKPVLIGETLKADGQPRTWQWGQTRRIPMARLHARVLALANGVRGPWSRVAIQAHYVAVPDNDTRPAGNVWKPRRKGPRLPDLLGEPKRKPGRPRTKPAPDPAAPKRRRGRPRVRLPDWL